MNKNQKQYIANSSSGYRVFRLSVLLFALFMVFLTNDLFALSKVSVASGDWNDPAVWNPIGIPVATDDVTISANTTITVNTNQFVHHTTIAANANILWVAGIRLTISGNLTVNGTANMNQGRITFLNFGQQFNLGTGSSFTWDPDLNTLAEATLFTKGTENFSLTSTLIIKRWYNYAVSLGSVITGDFGNLTINTPGTNNTIVEWNQKNDFQTHRVVGQLKVDQGWVTLDKSGSITVTSIGSIVLNSVNSVFYGHNGTHPSSFSIVTNSINNNGGTFYGLTDGNGDVSIRVLGDFNTYGNVKILNNSGVSGVANGNATLTVDGTYFQTTGDTRFVYNITTINSGTYTATFGNLIVNGGIFMGQTGCHTAGGTCSLTVIQNLTINFQSGTDKFRAASLTNIGTNINNAKINFSVGGNVQLTGINSSEFTGSASSGNEQFNVGGTFTQTGTTCSFNYGTLAASHLLQLQINSTTSLSGGTCYWSRNNGTATLLFGNNVIQTAGTSILKGGTGAIAASVAGKLNISGGTYYLHSNTGTPTTDSVVMNVFGNFLQSAGSLVFDDNATATSGTHVLGLNGDTCLFTGTGIITHAQAGTCPVFGQINYSKSGTIYYLRSSTHLIEQVKQNIKNGCTVSLQNNAMQIASYAQASPYLLTCEPGSILALNNFQVCSNSRSTYSSIFIDSIATISTKRTQGFYDGTLFGAVNSSGNMNYNLHANSIVEYNGSLNQTITGLSGTLQATQHKYGTLKINTTSGGITSLNGAKVFVRNKLDLTAGALVLSGFTLTLENGNPVAITRSTGYLVSEDLLSPEKSILKWQNISAGLHIAPFGTLSGTVIPINIKPVSGFGNDITIATRTTATDNLPYPIGITLTNSSFAINNVIDRWWYINANGVHADLTLTYAGTENTLIQGSSAKYLSIQPYAGTNWGIQSPITSLSIQNSTGTASILNADLQSYFIISTVINTQAFTLVSFKAGVQNNGVVLDWNTSNEVNTSYFGVEKSLDGITYSEITQVPAAGNSSTYSNYSYFDSNLLTGISYYRLKMVDQNGFFVYSTVRMLNYSPVRTVRILSTSPNPFTSDIHVSLKATEDNLLEIYSITGSKIYSAQINGSIEIQEIKIDNLDAIDAGVYILVLSNGANKDTKKIYKN